DFGARRGFKHTVVRHERHESVRIVTIPRIGERLQHLDSYLGTHDCPPVSTTRPRRLMTPNAALSRACASHVACKGLAPRTSHFLRCGQDLHPSLEDKAASPEPFRSWMAASASRAPRWKRPSYWMVLNRRLHRRARTSHA